MSGMRIFKRISSEYELGDSFLGLFFIHRAISFWKALIFILMKNNWERRADQIVSTLPFVCTGMVLRTA
ncbi:hypothetical protein BB776_00990 [Planococcus salinarum]|uniref:Uncharacterized protein n=1 Tax=Planococcus salinarum TaxID=622695 RepID=A0ABX3CVP1_9BACL|nr:hypothetical protein BB776_00990 [Planococcus salinarum]